MIECPSRRDVLASIGVGLVASVLAPSQARAISLPARIQRELSLEMARAYQLNGDRTEFNRLWNMQDAFRGIGAWPHSASVVDTAMSALTRVLEGESLEHAGFQRVVRMPTGRLVVFSDHHIVPDANRQSLVWRTNRDGYAKVLRHYGEAGWIVAENGDVEDLVILEPSQTVAIYEETLGKLTGKAKIRGSSGKRLQDWFRSDPLDLVSTLRAARAPRRQSQLDAILSEPGNRGYYGALAQLAASGQLVRLAGNHDYELQRYEVPADHLIPADILIFGDKRPYVVMHGHQFDEATNPGVAPLYGEVISECLGVWYQGPDRTWGPDQIQRILDGGFPNRLATHGYGGRGGNAGAAFLSALLQSSRRDDEEWARAWEGLFGHPIAWEYGAEDWAASVRGAFARPGRLVDDAMLGKQFFKFRHLDEGEIVQALARWDVHAGLVLGHSHEVRAARAGRIGRYYNSGAAGRFAGLLWALELTADRAEVVGWHVEPDGACQKYRFERRDGDMFSYFEALRSSERTP